MGDARRQELKAPSPDPPYGAPPAKIPAGGECGRGRGGRFRGALTPHTMPYRVITECAFRCHAGPGPPVSRVGILRPPRPFSACGPSPPPCTVWLFFQDRLRQALRSRKPGGSALCWLFERLSRVILKEFLMRCIEKTLYTTTRSARYSRSSSSESCSRRRRRRRCSILMPYRVSAVCGSRRKSGTAI